MALRGCLFDMDGVIVDSAVHHFVAWQRLADELSITFTEEDNHALKGLSRVDSLDHILRMGQLQLDEKTKVKLMDQKNAWYLELIKGMTSKDILPGAGELIEALVAEGLKVGLGSSSRNARLILDNVGLTPLFDVVVDGNHLTLSKPDPEVFLKGAEALGLAALQTLWFLKMRCPESKRPKQVASLLWASATPTSFLRQMWWCPTWQALPLPN